MHKFLPGQIFWEALWVTDPIKVQEVWEISMKSTTALGAELHSQGYITDEDTGGWVKPLLPWW